MRERGEPVIEDLASVSDADGYTLVEFEPDLHRA